MAFSEVSRRYAKALFELAKANKSLPRVIEELRVIHKAIMSDKAVYEIFVSQILDRAEKQQVLTKVLGGKACQEVQSLLELLNKKNRLSLVAEVAAAFELICDLDHGVTRGVVRSAAPLNPEARKKIEDTVSGVTKKKVILTFQEDPSLMGGMVAQVGGWTFDDSLDSHLIRMGDELNRRAN